MRTAPLRIAILAAPAVVIGLMGLNYIRLCADTLLAPGTGFKTMYTTPGGEIEISAKNYAITPAAGWVSLEGLLILGPTKNVITRVDRALVTGLFTNSLHPKIEIDRPVAFVERRADGRFDIQDLLPKTQETKGTNAFRVEVRNGTVYFKDNAHVKRPTTIIRVGSLVANGLGDATDLLGNLKLGGYGDLDFQARILGSRTRFTAQSGNVDASGILEYLQSSVERKYISAVKDLRTNRAGGKVSVVGEIRKGNLTGLVADVDLTGERAVYQKYFVEKWHYVGRATPQSIAGVINAQSGATEAKFNGSLLFTEKGWRIDGKLSGTKVSRPVLETYVPGNISKELDIRNGKIDTYVAIDQSGKLQTQALISAETMSYGRYKLIDPVIQAEQDGSTTLLKMNRVTLGGSRVDGFISLNQVSNAIGGALSFKGVNIAALGLPKEASQVRASVDGSVNLSGTLAKPGANFRLLSEPSLKVAKRWISIGKVEAVGKISNAGLTVDRGFLAGSRGNATLTGGINNWQKLYGQLSGRGIKIAGLTDSTIEGSIDVEAKFGGTVSNPLVTGRVEGYQVGNSDFKLPVALANISYKDGWARAEDIQLVKGIGLISGKASANLKTKRIYASGDAQGLEVSDLVKGDFSGVVSATMIEVSGTYEKPILTAEVNGSNLVLSNQKVDTFSASIDLRNNILNSSQFRGEIGGGKFYGFGNWDINKKTASVTAEIDSIRARDTFAQYIPLVSVRGAISGSVKAEAHNNVLDFVTANGTVEDLRLNRVLAGSGSWNVARMGSEWTAELDIGQLERYIQVTGFKFNEVSRAIEGNLAAGQLPLKEVILASESAFDPSEELKAQLAQVDGVLSIGADLGGTIEKPTVDGKVLSVKSLAVSNQILGDLSAVAKYKGESINLVSLNLEGTKLSGIANGTVGTGEKGEISLEGKIGSLDPALFAFLNPSLASIKSEIKDFSFVVSGPLKTPTLNASLDGSLQVIRSKPTQEVPSNGVAILRTQDAPATLDSLTTEPVNLNIYHLEVTPSQGNKAMLSFDAKVGFSVFQGDVGGTIPLDFSKGIDETAPLNARLRLNPQPLNRVAELISFADISSGTSLIKTFDTNAKDPKDRDWIRLSGTSKALRIDGGITAAMQTLRVADPVKTKRPYSTYLRDVDLSVQFEGDKVSMSGQARSSLSGERSTPNVQFATKLDIADLLNTATKAQPLSDRPIISGSLTLDALRIRQDGFQFGTDPPQPNAYVDATFTTVDKSFGNPSTIKISGTTLKPLIDGQVLIEALDSAIPTFGAQSGGSDNPTFDPRFALGFKFGALPNSGRPEFAHLKAATSDLYLSGSANLNGALSKPDLQSSFIVERGTLRLPGGLIRLDQGGTLSLDFRSGTEEAAALSANLVGRTRVTSLRNGNVPERYEITLGITGNLLAPSGLILDASSDPPDLTKERIIALLGQTDLLQSLFGQDRSTFNKDLQNAVTSYALPTLLGGVTDSLARGLGFEYLSLDYNAVENASLSFARSFGNGFFAIGRRQISEPLPGQPLIYDFRLAYRPRKGTDLVKALSFSLGTDQNVPFKIAVDYSTKFGSTNFPFRRILLKRPK